MRTSIRKAWRSDLFANFAQFVYDDANPENPIGPRSTTTSQTGRFRGNQLIPNTDAFLLAWQLGARFNFPKTIYAQFAPTFYNYTGSGDSFNIHFRGGEPTLSNTVIFNLTWGYGWRSDDTLGTGGAHDIAINPLDRYQIFQADLNVKF